MENKETLTEKYSGDSVVWYFFDLKLRLSPVKLFFIIPEINNVKICGIKKVNIYLYKHLYYLNYNVIGRYKCAIPYVQNVLLIGILGKIF